MKRIKELIVVEGIHDSDRLHSYFDCDTIETSGSGLRKEILEYIALAKDKRGVIIFTDPDASGNMIRERINQAIPGCKNAFVQKEDARTKKKVGIEHASKEVLEEALENVITYVDKEEETISQEDFYDLGLLGKKDSDDLRKKLGKELHIGNCNAKAFRKRLNGLGITKEECLEYIRQ